MRNLFSLIGFVVVLFLGLGWYLGWYKLDWTTSSDGKTRVQFDVDTKKVSGDVRDGAHRAEELIDNIKAKEAADKSKATADDKTPAPDAQTPAATKTPTAAGLPGPKGFPTQK